MQNSTSFGNLPLEIQQLVLSYLCADDLVRCTLVCSNWKDAVDDFGFWKRQFPVDDTVIEKYISEAVKLERKVSPSKQHDEVINGNEFQHLYSLLIRVIKIKSFTSNLDTIQSKQNKEHQANQMRWRIQAERLETEMNSQILKLNKITSSAFFVTLPFVLIALWMFSPTFSRIFWFITFLYHITSSVFGFFIPDAIFKVLDSVIYGLFCCALLVVIIAYYAGMCYAWYKVIPLSKHMWQKVITFFLGRTLKRLEREKVTLFQRVASDKKKFFSQHAKNQAREQNLKNLQWQTEVQLDGAILEASKAVDQALNNTYRPSKTNNTMKTKTNRKKTSCVVM